MYTQIFRWDVHIGLWDGWFRGRWRIDYEHTASSDRLFWLGPIHLAISPKSANYAANFNNEQEERHEGNRPKFTTGKGGEESR